MLSHFIFIVFFASDKIKLYSWNCNVFAVLYIIWTCYIVYKQCVVKFLCWVNHVMLCCTNEKMLKFIVISNLYDLWYGYFNHVMLCCTNEKMLCYVVPMLKLIVVESRNNVIK
jgi:hypothetical protein